MVDAVQADRLQSTVERLVAFGTRNDFSERSLDARARRFRSTRLDRAAVRSDRRNGGRTHQRRARHLSPAEDGKNAARGPRIERHRNAARNRAGTRLRHVESFRRLRRTLHRRHRAQLPAPTTTGRASRRSWKRRASWRLRTLRGTIVFACFDGEELGLWGSNHYARELAARHVPVLAVLNNDIIGNSVGGDGASEPNVIRVFSEALPTGTDIARVNLVGSENDSPSRELSRFIAEIVPVYVPGFDVRQIFRSDRFMRGGDQESFPRRRLLRRRFGSSKRTKTSSHQHQDVRMQNGVQYGDLPQYIDAHYLRRATQANVAALATLALGPAPPGDVVMLLQRLGYDSTLQWKPAADAVSYEVLWRATDAPQWEHATATSATSPTQRFRFQRTTTYSGCAASTPTACAAPRSTRYRFAISS